jgi:Fur family transcriptional regulator, ferric uptake regulator
VSASRGRLGVVRAADHHREHHTHDDDAERVDAVLDLLRTDGGRVTTGRRAIVNALFSGPDHHVTAEDVAALVQAEHPDVHLSTVYRTLDALEGLGVVARVSLGAGGAIYHLSDHAHHHLVCERCGSVTEVPDDAFAPIAAVADRYGFEVGRRPLAVPGLCAACRD